MTSSPHLSVRTHDAHITHDFDMGLVYFTIAMRDTGNVVEFVIEYTLNPVNTLYRSAVAVKPCPATGVARYDVALKARSGDIILGPADDTLPRKYHCWDGLPGPTVIP